MRLALLGVVVALSGGAARAHQVEARLSAGGVEFVQEQVRSFLPGSIVAPNITKTLFSCPGDDATFTQRYTVVNLDVHALDLALPEDGTIRVDVTLSAHVDGELYLDKPYACVGSTTCDDDIWIDHARAIIDLALWIDDNGQLRADLSGLDVIVTPEQITVNLSECAISGIVNTVIDIAKDYATEMLLSKVEEMAREKVGPMLSEMLQGFGGISVAFGPMEVNAVLDKLRLETNGINLGADVDIAATGAGFDVCPQPDDVGEPGTHPGDVPDLRDGRDTHLAAAVNLGLVDDALHAAWQSGMMCVTPEVLDLFNIELDISKVGDLLPGFPPGTHFSLTAWMLEPPRMGSARSDDLRMSMEIPGMVADVDAILPDGNTRTIHVELAATAEMEVGINPDLNAITLNSVAVTIDRLDLDEEASADELGFDFGGMRQLLQERVLPHVTEQLAGMPVTGPIFGGMMGFYVLLREIRTTEAFLVARLDLFRAPEHDYTAPDTHILSVPSGLVAARNAFVIADGTDAEIPTELLKYEATVDGVRKKASYVKRIPAGVIGKSGTYAIEVRAIDLAGNSDPSPARVDVTVDGILPRVTITEVPLGVTDTATPVFGWVMSDDLSDPDQITPIVTTYRMPRDGSAGQGDLVDTIELDPGVTRTTLSLDRGNWRAVITARDVAGNEASDAQIFTVDADAAKGCGCVAGGRGAGGPGGGLFVVVMGLGLAMIRIRRHS